MLTPLVVRKEDKGGVRDNPPNYPI